MRFYLLLLSYCCINSLLWAQGPPNSANPIGKITGRILDAKTKEPIPYATVSVIKLRDSSIAGGNLSDEKGNFLVDKIPFGGYQIQIDFIGYQQYNFKPIILKPDQSSQALGDIALKTSAENLGDVVVEEDAPAMRLSIDRKVFDAEKSQMAIGGTATDVLRNTPTLEVSPEGNVSLRGSEGVTVLINGRPTALTGSDRKALLDQIPANMVKSVEIITNPSAKYDPDGISGIINIVLKKNRLEGISGSISSSIGSPFNKFNQTAGISYRNEFFNLGASYNFQFNENWSRGTSYRTNKYGSSLDYLDQISRGLNSRQNHMIRLNGEWTPSAEHLVSGSFSLSQNRDWEYDTVAYQSLDANRDYLDAFKRFAFEGGQRLNLDANLSYTHRFKGSDKHTLVADATYSMSDGQDDETFDQFWFDANDQMRQRLPWQQRSTSIRGNQVLNVQVDYTRPNAERQSKLELGAKTILRNIDNDFLLEERDSFTGAYRTDLNQSNNFRYSEQIYAAYATYGQKIKKFGFQAGLRLEQAFTSSELLSTGQRFPNNYFSWFPSAHLSYELKTSRQLMLAYSRRINRPGTWSLNPFPSYTDPLNLRRGNPFLLPEYIDALELSVAEYWKKGSFTASAYYRRTTNVTQRIRSIDPNTGVTTTTFENLASNQSYGIETVLSTQLYPWWRLTASVNGFFVQMDGTNLNSEFSNQALAGHLNLSSNFTWKNGWSGQFNAFYRLPMKTVQGRMRGMFYGGLSVTKAVLKNKGQLSLRLEDPFFLQWHGFIFNDVLFDQDILRRWESRILYLSFTYNFGKLEVKPQRRGRRGDSGGGDMDMDM